MEFLLVVAGLLVLVWVLNKKFFIGKRFVIKITKSKAIVLKGIPPKTFIAECKIMARKKNTPGYIYGVDGVKGVLSTYRLELVKFHLIPTNLNFGYN